MSDCLVWRSSVPHRHKQFSRTRSAVTEYKGHLQLNRCQTTLLVSAANLWCSKGGESAVEFGETFGPYTKEAGYGV